MAEHKFARRLKRALDVTVSIFALIILSPAILVIGILVRWRMGRPVVFRQQRPGHRGVPFYALKFRTMTDERNEREILLPDAERITRLGTFLRRSSLDELPQLWNVLRGDMSLVGPRPLLMQYLDRYTPEQARRHLVPPGITGWTQVNGRNDLAWEQKLALDVWYVEHWSLWLDLRILAITVWKVLTGEGIAAKGSATMPEFMGTETPTSEKAARIP
ncbi:MAG TPA: sugar transferase [Candidatus Sulfotelmatobacter sp.]|jgi:sugar transferase EpsL|nr:sugar transferase [Candidatus Sulfotelmatobacter sp.]